MKSTQARIAEIAWQRSFPSDPQFFLSTTAITLTKSIFAVPYFIPLYIHRTCPTMGILLHVEKRRKKNEFGESSNDPRTIVPRCDGLQLHTQSTTPTFASHWRSFQSQRVESFAPTSKERIKSPGRRNWKEGRSERRTEGAVQAAEGATFPKLFPSNWPRAFLAHLPPSFFNPCNKIGREIKDAEVDRFYSKNRLGCRCDS